MKLSLAEPLKTKEIKKFGIPNSLTIHNFYAYQYAMCIFAIRKDNYGKLVYVPEYSQHCIKNNIKINEMLSFVESHKDIVIKEKVYDGGYFDNVYYIVYHREEKPSILNDFNNFNTNNVDIEIVFNENGYYRADELHLQLSSYTPIIKAINELFSIENIEVLYFINKTDNNQYSITYYDDFGRAKDFIYPDIESIYNRIISVRLVGCTEVRNVNSDTTTGQ